MLLQGAGQALCVWQQRTEAIYFLDVGQGDGILIRSPDGRNIVIDGGSTSQSKCGTYTLLPALRSQGMTEIDCWFVTHTDEDHISGLKELLLQGKLTQIKVRTVVFSAYVFQDAALAELEAVIRAAGITIVWMREGDVIGDDTFTLTCLHPTAEYRARIRMQRVWHWHIILIHLTCYLLETWMQMPSQIWIYNRIMIASSFRIMARSTRMWRGSMRMRTMV